MSEFLRLVGQVEREERRRGQRFAEVVNGPAKHALATVPDPGAGEGSGPARADEQAHEAVEL